MTPAELPKMVAELKRLRNAAIAAVALDDGVDRSRKQAAYYNAILGRSDALLAAAEECADWERWAKEVLTDFRIPFDDHKVGIRIAFTQWMADTKKTAEECERLRAALRRLVEDGECYCADGVAAHGPCGHCEARAALEGKP